MNFQTSANIIVGTPKIIVLPKDMNSLPISIQVAPESGGTLAVQVSCDSIDTLENSPSSALWTDLYPASVTASTLYSVETPISAIKMTATTANAKANVKTFKKLF